MLAYEVLGSHASIMIALFWILTLIWSDISKCVDSMFRIEKVSQMGKWYMTYREGHVRTRAVSNKM